MSTKRPTRVFGLVRASGSTLSAWPSRAILSISAAGLAWLLALVAAFLVGPIASAQSTAAVTGLVFEDGNGNGLQDEGEIGVANVVIVAIEEDTGAPITTLTGTDGSYRIEAEVINHRVRIDESSLPFNGELTTPRLEYNLNVPPGFFAPNVNFGYQEVQPAVATGLVFEDGNGNGLQDEGEPGLAGVTLVIVHDETGVVTTLATDDTGAYRFEAAGNINHRISVDESSLPFVPGLTTGRESYNLNVPPGFFAPNVNFGYQEVQPSAASGTVFDDLDGDGEQDENEPGLPGVTLLVDLGEGGGTRELLTDDAGAYRWEGNQRRFAISVDEETLPFADPILTTLRSTYTLNVPAGFIAPNVDFGYRAAGPEDQPLLRATSSGAGAASPEGADVGPGEDASDDGSAPQDAAETADPEVTQPPLLTPREGRWRARNGPLRLRCGGLNLDQPGLPPEDGRLVLRRGGDRLVMRGFAENGNQAVRVDRQPNRPERYVGGWPPIRVQGGRVQLRFVVDVISPERMEGVLRGSARVQGVSCQATREVDLRYVGR